MPGLRQTACTARGCDCLVNKLCPAGVIELIHKDTWRVVEGSK